MTHKYVKTNVDGFVISQPGAILNVDNAKGKSIGNNQAECDFNVKISNLEQLNELISRIKKIRNVKNVYLADLTSTDTEF